MDDDEVGYGKPPKHSRWKKGQSGNPSGRPKNRAHLLDELLAELSEKIWIVEGGKRMRVKKLRAVIKALTSAGIKGDARSSTIVVNLAKLMAAEADPQGEAALSPADRKIMEDFLDREFERRLAQRLAFSNQAQSSSNEEQASNMEGQDSTKAEKA